MPQHDEKIVKKLWYHKTVHAETPHAYFITKRYRVRIFSRFIRVPTRTGKTWENGKAFSRQDILNRLEKSENVRQILIIIFSDTKMDQVFGLKNITFKKNTGKMKKITGKSRNFVSPEKWEPCSSPRIHSTFETQCRRHPKCKTWGQWSIKRKDVKH